LAADITEEITHAQQLGQRIKQLGGILPGSADVKLGGQIQPSTNTTDVTGVIKAVINAEEQACAHYREVI
jgi:bacterioferritin